MSCLPSSLTRPTKTWRRLRKHSRFQTCKPRSSSKASKSQTSTWAGPLTQATSTGKICRSRLLSRSLDQFWLSWLLLPLFTPRSWFKSTSLSGNSILQFTRPSTVPLKGKTSIGLKYNQWHSLPGVTTLSLTHPRQERPIFSLKKICQVMTLKIWSMERYHVSVSKNPKDLVGMAPLFKTIDSSHLEAAPISKWD